jgi:hypothetical protein
MRGLEPDAGDCCGVYIPFIVFSSVQLRTSPSSVLLCDGLVAIYLALCGLYL